MCILYTYQNKILLGSRCSGCDEHIACLWGWQKIMDNREESKGKNNKQAFLWSTQTRSKFQVGWVRGRSVLVKSKKKKEDKKVTSARINRAHIFHEESSHFWSSKQSSMFVPETRSQCIGWIDLIPVCVTLYWSNKLKLLRHATGQGEGLVGWPS